MAASRGRHYDCVGNPILGFFEMREYYRLDRDSMFVLQRFLPHAYECKPEIWVRMDLDCPNDIEVVRVFPAGQSAKRYFIGKRALEFFREVMRGRVPGWKAIRKGQKLTFQRKGFLIPRLERKIIQRSA